VLAALLAALLSACTGDRQQAVLDDYLARVARPLDVEKPVPATPTLPELPRWTALQLPLRESSLDGLDFLKLRGCALQQTVARRNSSLGRMAPPSQRLLLALDFLRQVDPCIARVASRGESDLAALLTDAQRQKRAQLPAMIFNATLGSEEYRQFWRGDNRLGDYPAGTSSAINLALSRINADVARWLDGDFEAEEPAFELALADISAGDGGELLAALARQASYLDSGSALLRTRAPLCTPALKPGAAAVLRTVARKYFIGAVQPGAAALAQRQHLLLPPVQTLEAQLEAALPEAYRRWRSERGALLAQWTAAPKRHVAAWQALLGSCFSEFAPASA
jgi:hypothetical protein